MLTQQERIRYARHLVLPEFGEEGQSKLKGGSVLIVGAGGLGSPAALYLAAAGVGKIGLVDFDTVDATNLQRQILYGESSVGKQKLDAARERLHDLNPHISIETFASALTSQNARELFEPYDVILDGTDNFATRYLVNDACVLMKKPNVYGSIYRFDGQVSVFDSTRGPCYRCLFPDPPPPHLVPNCAEGGVLGVLPGIIGTIQAAEAIKLLAGVGVTLIGRMLIFDALTMSTRQIRLAKNPQCKVCGPDPVIRDLIDYEEYCSPVNDLEISASQLSERLTRGEDLVLLDVREPYEFQAGHLEDAQHIPMQQVPHSIDQLPRNKELVVYCRTGGRSARVQQFLMSQGFEKVKNLTGGMMAWKREIDPAMTVR